MGIKKYLYVHTSATKSMYSSRLNEGYFGSKTKIKCTINETCLELIYIAI